jgi:hypothetical protein
MFLPEGIEYFELSSWLHFQTVVINLYVHSDIIDGTYKGQEIRRCVLDGMSKLIIEETDVTEVDFQNVLLEQNVATKIITGNTSSQVTQQVRCDLTDRYIPLQDERLG